MSDETDLLGRIEAFLVATGVNPSDFGEAAINDRNLVPQLRRGRELRRKTRERIERHLNANWPEGLKKIKTQQLPRLPKGLSASSGCSSPKRTAVKGAAA